MKKLFTLLTLMLCVVGTAWGTDYTWTFDAYWTANTVNNADVTISKSATTVLSSSNSNDLSYVTGNNSESKVVHPTNAATVGGVSYSSYLYMGGIGAQTPTGNLRYFTTGTITGRGTLTIVYAGTVGGTCYIYDSSNTVENNQLTTITPVASTAVSSATLDLGEGKSLTICHTNKCYIYAIKWTAESETGISVSYSVSPLGAGSVSQSPVGSKLEEGTEVSFTATANAGYKFVNWTDDNNGNAVLGTDATYTIASLSEATAVTANFEQLYSVNFSVGETGATAVLPAVKYYDSGTEITLPANHYFYKEGQSVTKWTDGTNEYALGATYTVTGNVVFYPVFSEAPAFPAAATTVTWTFSRDAGSPAYAIEGNNKTTDVIASTASGVDLKMVVNTVSGPDPTDDSKTINGKFNNNNYPNRAQVNIYTSFTIPAVSGMTVTYTGTNGTAAVADNVLFGEDHAASVSGSTYTYTYNGSATTLTIYDNKGGLYPSGITVSYPKVIGEPSAPISPETVTETVTFTKSSSTTNKAVSPNTYESVVTVSNPSYKDISLTGYAGALELASSTVITISLPTGATNASVTLIDAESTNKKLKVDGTDDTSRSWTGSAETGYSTTIAIPDTKAGGTFTIAKKDSGTKIVKITLTYDLGTAGQITLNVDSDLEGWRSFYDASQDYEVDEDTKIYVVRAKADADNTVTLTAVDGSKIKAGTPVILRNTSYVITLTETTGAEEIGDNLLAVTNGSVVDGYRLGYGADGVRFYAYTAAAPATGIVYIAKTNVNGANARSLNLVFDDEATAIQGVETVTGKTAPRKVVKNGRVVIETSEGTFTLSGARVQ